MRWERSIESGSALKLLAGEVVSGYFRGPLEREAVVQPFRWTFRAKGKGGFRCVRVAFTDTPDKESKTGYTRKMHPPEELVSATLTSEWKTFSGTVETLPNAQNGIRFIADRQADEVFVDDVSVVLAPTM